MILGRPTNQWAGLVTAALAFAQVLIVNVLPDVDPAVVATILGSLGVLLGALIALVAGQPPTVQNGGAVVVQTPSGQPNATATLELTPTPTGPEVTATPT